MPPFCVLKSFLSVTSKQFTINQILDMDSPNFLSNDDLEVEIKEKNILKQHTPAKITGQLKSIIYDNCTKLFGKGSESFDEDDESKLAALEEHTRQLLIELQLKRNDALTARTLSKVENGWAERERSAVMRAETAEGRAMCATAAANRLAEERETLNQMAMEVKGKYEAAAKENELLTAQIRTLSIEISTHERREREILAEKASYETAKRTLNEKMEKMRNTVDEVNRWISNAEDTKKRFQEDIDATQSLASKMKEYTAKKEAEIQEMRDRLQEATETIAKMSAKIGALEAKMEISKKIL